MRFKKIYIEITNSCNFNCSFCFPSIRKKKFITTTEFREVVQKIRPFSDFIYLHVLGEPLLHPQLDELLTIAEDAGLFVNITTNGALIEQKKEILRKHHIRQLNISIHDIEENIQKDKIDDYLNEILTFAQEVAAETYVCLRFWNQKTNEQNPFNDICLRKIKEKLNISENLHVDKTKGNGIKLANHIFLQNADRFEWPDLNKNKFNESKTCYALKDHIAILSDGSVVPCCLDADANLFLGNIFNENLSDILNNKRAIDIKKGFSEKKAVEKFCMTCGFKKE